MELSSISDTYDMLTEYSPIHLPDCCSSLSVSFLKRLASLLPSDPELTLSIGSGTGLLEALLLHQRPTLDLKAVEVPTTNNKYIPADRIQIVNGYRDLCNLAADANAWIFVYPRDVWLLHQYVQAFGGQKCDLIIWIGPRADQLESDFFGAMWFKEDFQECGLKDYETMALWRRRRLVKAEFKATDCDPFVIS